MPTIRIQGTDLAYQEKDIIHFDEGLIGMPHLRRMVLINYSEVAPLLLLCSPDDPQAAFLVLETSAHFSDYQPSLSSDIAQQLSLVEGEKPVTLVTVTIAPEWTASTINLRAPIIIAPTAMRGSQIVLTDSPYQLNEPLPLAWLAVSA